MERCKKTEFICRHQSEGFLAILLRMGIKERWRELRWKLQKR